MDAAGVDRSLISAWRAPGGDMISNDEVAAFVAGCTVCDCRGKAG